MCIIFSLKSSPLIFINYILCAVSLNLQLPPFLILFEIKTPELSWELSVPNIISMLLTAYILRKSKLQRLRKGMVILIL
ncbi:hypothetical protein VNO77_16311 [Canavalia gladiata]|uniref:Uncharacterized protein n=1 Tax=Canavalia gladiata TaxID=3824 RepID=A0AAN9M1I0_CANGL